MIWTGTVTSMGFAAIKMQAKVAGKTISNGALSVRHTIDGSCDPLST